MTINATAPSQIFAAQSPSTASINLLNQFDDSLTTGLVARFTLRDKSLAGGVTEVLLFDQEEDGAPLTVENFQTYVEAGDYKDTIIHRALTGFVVQGGGFSTTNSSSDSLVNPIDSNDPVVNEFSPDRSNVRGTIAMAKLDGNPDSATNQWFFNLGDNGFNLDNQNEGFTVFGQVLGQDDLDVIDAIADLPTVNAGGAFTNLPVIDFSNSNTDLSVSNLVRYKKITLSTKDELKFSLVSNSNPALVSAKVKKNNLRLNYVANQSGTATLVIEVENLLGETIESELVLNVMDGVPVGTAEPDSLLGNSDNNTLDGGDGNDSLLGLGGNDQISGGDGSDLLIGGIGDDTLKGGKGNDTLEGEKGKDNLDGGKGNDVVDGGKGGDRMKGGRGKDEFVLQKGPDSDDIRDFKNGQDKLRVIGRSFSDLTIEGQGKNTIISMGKDELAILNGVRPNSINQADFV